MSGFFSDLNWVGGLVGAVIAYLLGAVWYSPKVFGQSWMDYQGRKPEDIGSPGPAMVISAIYHLVLAVFVMVLYQVVPPSAYRMVLAVFMLTAAFSILQRCMYEGRPAGFWRINAGHEVAVILVIALSVAYIG